MEEEGISCGSSNQNPVGSMSDKAYLEKDVTLEQKSTTLRQDSESRLRASPSSPNKAFSSAIPFPPRINGTPISSRKGESNPHSDVSLAQSDDVLKKCLRTGELVTEPTKPFSPTVPVAPHFHESRRPKLVSDKTDVSLAQSVDVLRKGLRSSSALQPPTERKVSITTPEAPKFHITNRLKCETRPRSNISIIPLAQSDEILRKGLRDGKDQPASSRPLSVTTPTAPRFSEIKPRKLPKSADEMEQELMEQFRQHPFKARDAPVWPEHNHPEKKNGETTSPRLHTTKPQPFHFRCDDRAQNSSRRPIERPPTQEEIDMEECKNKFKAKPLPKSLIPSTRSSSRSRKVHRDDDEPVQQFKARPLPITTFIADSLVSSQRSRSRTPSRKGTPRGSRASSRTNSPNQSQTSKKQDISPPSEPFHLKSVDRHEKYQIEHFKRMAMEELEHQLQTQFRARPIPLSTYVPHSVNHTTGKHHSPQRQTHSARFAHIRQERASTPSNSPPLYTPTRSPLFAHDHSTEIRPLDELSQKSFDGQSRKMIEYDNQKSLVGCLKSSPSYKTVLSPPSVKSAKELYDTFALLRSESDIDEPLLVDDRALPLRSASTSKGAKHVSFQSRSSEQASESQKENYKYVNDSADVQSLGSSAVPTFPLVLVLLLLLFRIMNAMLVQSYFDPDEFWQTLEPAYCTVFRQGDACEGFTWEWKRRHPKMSSSNFIERSLWGPVRSYLSLVPTLLFYSLLKNFDCDSYWLVSKGPMILNSAMVAAPVDIAVWYIARWMPESPSHSGTASRWSLFCSMVSWFNGYALVRTYANGQETLLLILAVALVSPELIGDRTDCRRVNLRSSLAFFLGGLSVTIRFTSLAAFIPMGLILAWRRTSIVDRVKYLFFPCAMFGAIGVAVGLLIDFYFYGFWTLPLLGNFHFNAVLNNASLYGSHPPHWYVTAGLPAIAGLLLPCIIVDYTTIMISRKWAYGHRNLSIIMVTYLMIMSLNIHKEFRFIHPILPLICLLAGSFFQRMFECSRGWLFKRLTMYAMTTFLVVANLVTVLYLGLIHQTGPIKVNQAIVRYARIGFSDQPGQSTFSIHYLTGSCHSTPLLSSLHIPPIQFKPWALDCSPSCRADPNALCESELFHADPVRFLNEAYFGRRRKSLPDFIVSFSEYEAVIEEHLARFGYHALERYPHSLTGVRVSLGSLYSKLNELLECAGLMPGFRNFVERIEFDEFTFGKDFELSFLRKYSLAGWLDISFNEMIVFVRIPGTSYHSLNETAGDGAINVAFDKYNVSGIAIGREPGKIAVNLQQGAESPDIYELPGANGELSHAHKIVDVLMREETRTEGMDPNAAKNCEESTLLFFPALGPMDELYHTRNRNRNRLDFAPLSWSEHGRAEIDYGSLAEQSWPTNKVTESINLKHGESVDGPTNESPDDATPSSSNHIDFEDNFVERRPPEAPAESSNEENTECRLDDIKNLDASGDSPSEAGGLSGFDLDIENEFDESWSLVQDFGVSQVDSDGHVSMEEENLGYNDETMYADGKSITHEEHGDGGERVMLESTPQTSHDEAHGKSHLNLNKIVRIRMSEEEPLEAPVPENRDQEDVENTNDRKSQLEATANGSWFQEAGHVVQNIGTTNEDFPSRPGRQSKGNKLVDSTDREPPVEIFLANEGIDPVYKHAPSDGEMPSRFEQERVRINSDQHREEELATSHQSIRKSEWNDGETVTIENADIVEVTVVSSGESQDKDNNFDEGRLQESPVNEVTVKTQSDGDTVIVFGNEIVNKLDDGEVQGSVLGTSKDVKGRAITFDAIQGNPAGEETGQLNHALMPSQPDTLLVGDHRRNIVHGFREVTWKKLQEAIALKSKLADLNKGINDDTTQNS